MYMDKELREDKLYPVIDQLVKERLHLQSFIQYF